MVVFVMLERDRADYERNSDCQHRQKANVNRRRRRRQIAPIIVFDVVILRVIFWRRGQRRRPERVEGVNRLRLVKVFVLRRRRQVLIGHRLKIGRRARKRQRSSQDAGAHPRRAGLWDSGADKSNRHAPCWR